MALVTDHPRYPRAVIVAEVLATTGSTIRNTAVELRTVIGLPRIDLGAQHEEILSPIAKPAPGNSSVARAAIWPVIVAVELASEIQAERAWAIVAEITGLATDRQAARIASEAATCLGAAAEIATLLVEVPEVPRDTTAQVLEPAAIAAA